MGDAGLIKVAKKIHSGTRSGIFGHIKMGTFGKSAHIGVPKNSTSGAQMKILLPLLYVQHPPKMMDLPLVLSVYHFWVGFEPIFKFGCFPLVFYIMSQKK